MLPQFKRDADGCLTFYIQTDSPGADKDINWLPAPKGPTMVMRLYWPNPRRLTACGSRRRCSTSLLAPYHEQKG